MLLGYFEGAKSKFGLHFKFGGIKIEKENHRFVSQTHFPIGFYKYS